MSTKEEIALSYAERGWAVFPLQPNTKIPFEGTHGHKDASTSLDQIRDWWGAHPDANIAIATGDVSGGLVIIDVDVNEGKQGAEQFWHLQKQRGPLNAPTSQTWSGGVHHWCHAYGVKSRAGALAPHVDVKANGGYIVAPGSTIDDQPYHWINEGEPIPLPQKWIKSAEPTREPEVRIENDTISRGTRDATLFRLACSLRNKGLPQATVLDITKLINTKHCDPPLSPSTVAAKVRSAFAQDRAGDETLGAGDLYERVVYIYGQNEFWDRKLNLAFHKDALNAYWLDRGFGMSGAKSAAAYVLVNPDRLQAETYDYLPGAEEFCGKSYNLYRPGLLRPAQERSDETVWDKHLEYLFNGDAEQIAHFETWMAWVAQHPEEPIEHAIVVQGIQGVGKSILGFVARKIVGEQNATQLNPKNFDSDFNDWLANRVLIVIDELFGFGSRAVNNLKYMIGTAGEIIINRKYHTPYKQTSVANFMMFTNHEDALKIEHDDRRFWVAHCTSKPRDPKYMKNLWKWTREHLPSLFARYLAIEVEEGWAKLPPPKTTAKRHMELATMTPLEQEVLVRRQEREPPFDTTLFSSLELRDFLQREAGYHNISTHAIAAVLEQAGATRLGQAVGLREGRPHQPTLWAWERGDLYKDLSRKDLYVRWQRERTSAKMGEDPEKMPF